MTDTAHFWRDPAMPFVESRRACQSRACYRPHNHPTFSIGAVDQGASVFTGANNPPITLKAGMVVFVPAGKVHACNPSPGTQWSYQMLHLNARWLQTVRSEYAECGVELEADEAICIVDQASIYQAFCRLNELLFSPAGRDEKESALIDFMATCDLSNGVRVDPPYQTVGHVERLDPVLALMEDTLSRSRSLSELSDMVGMSRYQFIRAFRARTGMSPHAWQLNQRINLGRDRIREGGAIATVAQELGFADQAHFQRMFKAFTGITPARYRR
ncbi:helix-turn-helix transcriptional regulator [Halomonas aquamarina]|uniref:Helix-turn-helix transcriptional regulator n=1 Tax=Vreelandella aquamarina TaxID=77097 RepID=A0ACC5VW61_9GAMM|nr:AraC family transcriptional regulator [Halomonas aquamarina]MBZ5488378.1 helix-turn-helix transcriptional regulator [Halomonas aquamarina]